MLPNPNGCGLYLEPTQEKDGLHLQPAQTTAHPRRGGGKSTAIRNRFRALGGGCRMV
jgi:hypothetical protein